MRLLLSLLLGGVLIVATGIVPAVAQEGDAEKEAEKLFASADANADGRLSESEFSTLVNPNLTDDQKKQVFAQWDANNDGWISKNEFVARYSAQQRQQRQ